MKIVIIGAGALGSLVGGRLAQSGQDVTLYNSSNQEHIHKIQHESLILETPENTSRVALRATTQASELGGYDLAIILVKAYSTKVAVNDVRDCLKNSCFVLSLQNGYGFEPEILQHVQAEKFLRGTTTQGATLVRPGQVRQAGQGLTYLGFWQRESISEELQKIVQIFNQAGLMAQYAANIREHVWSKLIVNSAINPLAALFDVPNGELLEREKLRELLHSVTRESVTIANGAGFAFTVETFIARVEEVCKRTAQNINSMLQDVRQKKPTEIDFINGAIVQEARRLNLDAPLNQLLLELVRRQSHLPIPRV
jgi:2-dehydropantoate 2-reductase